MAAETKPLIENPPPRWKHVSTWAIGGLFQVGYAEGLDLLLVLSSQGRGIFDCLTGEKLARDDEEAHDFLDAVRLTASGFGPLNNRTIRTAGLFGGGLPRTTNDGWFAEKQMWAWPTRSIYLAAPRKREPVVVADDGACELRAFGFSETGRSFVVATSCDLTIFAR